jgi:signal transduction histidine kinase
VLGRGAEGGEAVSEPTTIDEREPAAVTADAAWRATAAAGAALLAGLVLVLVRDVPGGLAAALLVAGLVIGAFVLVPRAVESVPRRPGLLLVGLALVVLAAWFASRVVGVPLDRVRELPGGSYLAGLARLSESSFWPFVLTVVTAVGGLVLIADALRVRLARRAAAHRAPWQELVAEPEPLGFPWRAVAGVLLVGWSAVLGVGLVGQYVADRPGLMVLAFALGVVGIAVVVGVPLLIAGVARTEQEDEGRARDAERQRFAAHLHDSVLQTLALVQRQAHDPAAVTKLARRQEHALRAWMAGESDLLSGTLAAALRDVVAEVEDEASITVELSTIGDRPVDAAGEVLVAATREALRNAARHGGGAPVFVFAELSPGAAAVFVRDEGPGFVPGDVPTERRGIRDAIVGRMAAVGGRATIDSAPGEGTEVALRLDGPAAGGGR